MAIELDINEFRQQFPYFSDPVKWPDARIQGCFDAATCYVSDEDFGCLRGACRKRALYLMTAHLCRLGELAEVGASGGVTTSASIGRVSVSVQPPPTGGDQWSWWLSQTLYGQELEALLSSAIVGGIYIGGRPERSAFRKFGGSF